MWYLSFFVLLICAAVGQIEVGYLRSYSSSLQIINDTCTWQGFIRDSNFGPADFGTDSKIDLPPKGAGSVATFVLKCLVDDNVQLQAITTAFDIDEVPSPNITSLDVAENMLAWTHVFQPSDLPPDFQLVHEFTLSYLVHMTDRDDVEAATSVTVNETSFNIEDMLDTCRRQDFTVQAVIDNEPRSENSSPASGFSVAVPVFTSLSASLLDNFTIKVSFQLERTHCLSVFTVTDIEGMRTAHFTVTTTNIVSGEMYFELPLGLLSGVDVCSVRGVVFGGNHNGNSRRVGIKPPTDCPTVPSPSTSVVISSSTSTVIDVIHTESTTVSSKVIQNILVASIGTAVIIMIVAGIIALSLFLTIYKCRAPKTAAVAEDLPLQRNEAYSTVVPLKRNEAYEIVQRTGLGANNVDSQTSHDYETILVPIKYMI